MLLIWLLKEEFTPGVCALFLVRFELSYVVCTVSIASDLSWRILNCVHVPRNFHLVKKTPMTFHLTTTHSSTMDIGCDNTAAKLPINKLFYF